MSDGSLLPLSLPESSESPAFRHGEYVKVICLERQAVADLPQVERIDREEAGEVQRAVLRQALITR